MNLHSNDGAVNVQLNHALTIYQNANTGNYSFNSTTDVRVNTLQALAAASQFYSDYFSTYEEVRITGVTVYIAPVQFVQQDALTSSNIIGALFLSLDPEFIYSASPSNPSNSIVIDSNRSHMISAKTIDTNVVSFKFPGVGAAENIWLDTSVNLNGAIFIGDISTSMSGIVSQPAYDCVISISSQFRAMRTH